MWNELLAATGTLTLRRAMCRLQQPGCPHALGRMRYVIGVRTEISMSLAEREGRGRAKIGGKIIEFTDKDIREAARLLALIANAGSPSLEDLLKPRERGSIPDPALIDRHVLLSRARRELSNRQLRTNYFSPGIFSESAWEVLLVLYITEFAGGRQTLRRLADWVHKPISTVLRWICYLEKERLVEREAHPSDRRMIYVTLLDKGRERLDAYLSTMAE